MPDHPFDLRLKVMDHAQSVIQRLAGNSFLMKGWAITLASLLLGFAVKDASAAPIAYLAILPTAVFWLLDGYYLALERKFRGKYADALGAPEGTVPDLAVTAMRFCQLGKAALAPATVLPYASLLVCEIILGAGLFSAAAASLHAG